MSNLSLKLHRRVIYHDKEMSSFFALFQKHIESHRFEWELITTLACVGLDWIDFIFSISSQQLESKQAINESTNANSNKLIPDVLLQELPIEKLISNEDYHVFSSFEHPVMIAFVLFSMRL